MSTPRYLFGAFLLDPGNRRLLRDGAPLALNARYFDALVLLVREHDRLVGKQRFFDEVWAGSVVTDAALTQCIKTLRRLLDDDSSAPRFVRTVPGHGYSFIAPVVELGEDPDGRGSPAPRHSAAETDAAAGTGEALHAGHAQRLPGWLGDSAAATAGGLLAGVMGGLLYGSAIAFSPQGQGLGALSVLLVMLVLSAAVGMSGALGVSLGMGWARALGRGEAWILPGGALGGLAVGGIAKLLGSDTFSLLVGRAPSGITGALEGAAIGLALAAGLLLGGGLGAARGWRPAIVAAATTAVAGALIALAGGSLMASSLMRVATAFDASRLDMAALGRLFGEPQFGPLLQAALGAVEGGIFGGCVAAAMLLARRGLR